MKTLVVITFICLFTSISEAQIKAIQAKKIAINFDKTIHLVFDEEIKYFNKGSEDILCSKVDEVPNILKIKANNENFTEETNITAITNSGLFYSFSIGYKKLIDKSTILYVEHDSTVIPEQLPISTSKNVHLIFPSKIKYTDTGNDQTVKLEPTGAANVIRFKAEFEDMPETNLSVYTEDGRFYSFNLKLDEGLNNFNYLIGKNGKALLGTENEQFLTECAQKASEKARTIYYIGLNKNKMEFYCSNIFIQNDILFFCCGIKNSSNINFNTDFVKCFVRDLKKLKNTTIQETEMMPLIKYNFREVVNSNQEIKFVLAFNKFTIPDKKKFEIEIFDKDGGRHLRFRIKNKPIINALKLN